MHPGNSPLPFRTLVTLAHLTTTLSAAPVPPVEPDGLPLRAATQLDTFPAPRPEGEPPRPAQTPETGASAPASGTSAPAAAPAQPEPQDLLSRVAREATAIAPRSTWIVSGAALLASVAWLVERRRRMILETRDSLAWASSQHVDTLTGPTTDPRGKLDRLLPDGPDPAAAAARAVFASAIGQTDSRREATLIDLHQLKLQLSRRRERGDNAGAALLLQQHLVDFRYSSPWVFLELRELYRELDRPRDWELARDAFRARFGQNAPTWEARSGLSVSLTDDRHLSAEIVRHWPFRETRLFILRWMLGDPQSRQRNSGPPQLPLGVYREMLTLDEMLDEVMAVRPKPPEALL